VAPAFSASADFAIDKPAGTPCPNLRDDFRCGIHERLRPRGFPGCAVYDCFGAGQRVAQETFGGSDWRGSPEIARRMYAVFGVMRHLHELLWYLTEALRLDLPRGLRDELRGALDETERLAAGGPDDLVRLDVKAHRDRVSPLLRNASEQVRAELRPHPVDRSGADLLGGDLRKADLRAASLRGASLVGANLRGADLRGADLTGADLRGADLGGADLRGAIFVTQSQLDAAMGDGRTRLPEPGSLGRPQHWTGRPPARRA
jgi:hypothetical protein